MRAEEVTSRFGGRNQAVSGDIRNRIRHGGYCIVGRRLNSTHARVHGYGAVLCFKALFDLSLDAAIIKMLWRGRRLDQAIL